MTIYLVTFVAMLNQIGFSGSRVVVSLYALDLGANQLAVGTIIALYSLCPMLLAITIGKLTDRIGPRIPMIVGCVFTAVALALPPIFSTFAILYLVALVVGTSHQFFSIPTEAGIGGIDGPEHRARNYSILTMGWAIATAAGPLVAGFAIDYLGHRECFILLAAFSTAPALILWSRPRLMAKAEKHPVKDKHGGSVFDLWRLPPMRTTIIASGIIGSAKDLFQFYMPVYGHSIGLTASAIGMILGLVALAAFVIRAALPFLVHRLSEKQILISAVYVSAVAFLLLPFFGNPWVLAALAFLLGLGVGSAEPMMLSLMYVISPAGRVAEALGLHKTVRLATQLVVPVIFGSVGAAFGYAAVFLSNTVMLTGGGLLLRKVGVPESDLRRRKPSGH